MRITGLHVSNKNTYLFVHTSNGTIAFTYGKTDRPADIAIVENRKTRVLTQLNEDILGHRNLGKVNEITYKSSFDNQEIQGWYITPPDFDPSKKLSLFFFV